MYKVADSSALANGTSLLKYVSLKPKDMMAIFGEPFESDEFKVSPEWIFVHEVTGEVFTIYDWKSTNLYDSRKQSVCAFRSSTKEYEFHVGGYSSETVDDFISWISSYVKNYYLNKEMDKLLGS